MKIIKRGSIPKKEKPKKRVDPVIKKTCENCSTEFEFHQSEWTFWPDATEPKMFWVNCPVCKKHVYADSEDGTRLFQ